MKDLDQFDRAILRALQTDGRLPVLKLAEKVALSATPCGRRVKMLEESGVVESYRAVLSPKKIGLNIMAFVQVNLSEHTEANTSRFQTEIAKLDSVLSCHAVTGEMDYLLQVVAEDIDQLNDLVMKTIRRIDGVRDIKSSIAIETLKENAPLPLS